MPKKEPLVTIQSKSTKKASIHELQVKGVKVEVTRDELMQINDEIEFYLETPPAISEATGGTQQ